jgi:uncharacterized protein
VQDADKLDAIGALGIMRCSAYSVVVNRPLYSSTTPEGELDKNCSIQHYYDKLLKLQGMLRMEEGSQLGAQRHDFIQLFLKQLESETNWFSFPISWEQARTDGFTEPFARGRMPSCCALVI